MTINVSCSFVHCPRSGCFLIMAMQFGLLPLFADHLPANLVAKGNSEAMLAGISIRRPFVALSDLERKWGMPTNTSESENRNSCDRVLSWRRRDATISVSVGCESARPDKFVIYTVQVLGRDPMRRFATGRGLSLGDSLKKLVDLYGTRLLITRSSEGLTEVLIQWRDGTELNATVDQRKHIQRLQLLPQVE
jgi:hypothetical protein